MRKTIGSVTPTALTDTDMKQCQESFDRAVRAIPLYRWRTCSLSSSWGELFKQLCRVNLKDSLGTIVIFRCAPSLLGVPKYRHLGRESYFFLFFCEESCPVEGSSSEDPSSVDSGVPKITAIA